MKKNMSVSLSDFVDDVYILKALTRYNNKFKIISESVAEHSYFVSVLTLKLPLTPKAPLISRSPSSTSDTDL